MIGYHCDCGLNHVDKAYNLRDVVCDNCGRRGAFGKTEITKDNVNDLCELSWAWRYMKDEPLDSHGGLFNACWGFSKGTPFVEIADWFFNTACDIVADEHYFDDDDYGNDEEDYDDLADDFIDDDEDGDYL